MIDDAAGPGHVIRLHAAWQRSERSDEPVISRQASLSLPDTLPVTPSTTHLVYVRKFHAPTGLDASQRVRFESELLRAASSAALNGDALDLSSHPAAIDITERLKGHNEIALCLPVDALDIARAATARLAITAS